MVSDAVSYTHLIGVSIYLPELKKGAISDENGNYSIANLPAIKTTIQVNYVGQMCIRDRYITHVLLLFIMMVKRGSPKVKMLKRYMLLCA